MARLEIRAVSGEIRIRNKPVPGPLVWANFSCVRIREIGHVPNGEKPIEWKLLTSYDVRDFEDALKVLRSYTFRWRAEEFHKTWKTGACDIESSQLRSYDALVRWGVILATVAVRVERLKRISREKPEAPALTELSQDELDAVIILSETKKFKPGDALTLEQAVRLIASVGGYIGDAPIASPLKLRVAC